MLEVETSPGNAFSSAEESGDFALKSCIEGR